MQLKSLIKSSGMAALAAALAVTALPGNAFAEGQRGWNGGRNASAQMPSARTQGGGDFRANRVESRGDFRANRIENRGEARANRIENRGDFRARQVQRQTNNLPPRAEAWGDRRSAEIQRNSERRADNVERRAQWRADRVDQRSENRADRIRNNDSRWRSDARNGSYRDNDRNRTYTDRDRNWSYRDRDRSNNRWDRRWRENRRYDWSDYRRSHRHIYRMGRYYAPYDNYSYRRFSIGFFLDSGFYGSRYWIDDPSYYRLPPAYGPYRWVRYYDDALLVDIYSGEVVDVIYDFFW